MSLLKGYKALVPCPGCILVSQVDPRVSAFRACGLGDPLDDKIRPKLNAQNGRNEASTGKPGAL